MFTIILWKTCSKCKRRLLATREFFHQNLRNGPALCAPRCKDCMCATSRRVRGRTLGDLLPWVNKSGPEVRAGLGSCWLWTGALNPDGYGKVGDDYVHRVVFEQVHGPLDAALFVCHRCDNPPCCNPAHLFAGRHKDNAADMAAKGRSTHGEKNAHAKLSPEQVRELRALRDAGHSAIALAERFGLSRTHVSAIVRGSFWRRRLDAGPATAQSHDVSSCSVTVAAPLSSSRRSTP